MRASTPVVVAILLLVSLAAQADRAAAVLADARTALGGDSRISTVRTFVATGRTRQLRGENLVPIEFEIQAELPGKFARRDEVPAQDTAPSLSGFNGDTLVLIPPPPADQPSAALQGRVVAAKQDFARLMLGMFATSFPSFPLTFAYVAQAEAPQGKADVIDVTGPANFKGRFFVDSQTHLPLMLTWQAAAPLARGGRPGGPPGAPAPGRGEGPPLVEQRMFFADYREVDGLHLPFRIRRAVGADTIEETIFDRFRINARVDPRRFAPGN